MGLMQREKGKRYERQVADRLRRLWPGAVVRRASQADRAHQSDVFVERGTPLQRSLWIECQDARRAASCPREKLLQAERDVSASCPGSRVPVVFWHVLGERRHHATMRVESLLYLMRLPVPDACEGEVVTMEQGEFLGLVSAGVAAEPAVG